MEYVVPIAAGLGEMEMLLAPYMCRAARGLLRLFRDDLTKIVLAPEAFESVLPLYHQHVESQLEILRAAVVLAEMSKGK